MAQSPVKKKRKTENVAIKEETMDEDVLNDSSDLIINSYNSVWNGEELIKLLELVTVETTSLHDQKYSYIDKIKWEPIAENFKHSSEECRDMFLSIYKKPRKFRSIGEVLQECKDLLTTSKKSKIMDQVLYADRPKKPAPPMTYFIQAKMPSIKKKNPEKLPTTLMRELCEKYQSLSPSKKAKYEQMTADAKDEYVKKLADYQQIHPDYMQKKSSSVQMKNGTDGLVDPPVKFYMKKKLKKAKNQGKSNKEMEDQYRQLGEEQKAKYVSKAFKSCLKKREEMEDDTITVKLLQDELYAHIKSYSIDPKDANLTSYMLFCRTQAAQKGQEGMSFEEKNKQNSEMWKNLSTEDKTWYKDTATELKTAFSTNIQSALDDMSPEEQKLFMDLHRLQKGKNGVYSFMTQSQKRKASAMLKTEPETDEKVDPEKEKFIKNTIKDLEDEDRIMGTVTEYKQEEAERRWKIHKYHTNLVKKEITE